MTSRQSTRLCSFLAALLLLGPVKSAVGQLVVSEFMADNVSSYADEEGDYPDWIEIWNTSASNVSTAGWSLTDSGNPRKWPLPTFTMAAGTRRIIFASGLDRRNPGATLHTNFKLDADGEYLALVNPANVAVSMFFPKYPAQAPNVAYGLAGGLSTVKVVVAGGPVRWKVPASASDFATNFLDWNATAAFNDSAWTQAAMGVGYDTDIASNSTFLGMVGTNGNCQAAMLGINGSVFLRCTFIVSNAPQIASSRLFLKYEDGFAAWVNGIKLSSDLAPTNPVWNSLATAARAEASAFTFTQFPITNTPQPFVNGTNVLALQGLNSSVGSSDMIVQPELTIIYSESALTNNYAYLFAATPGSANAAGSTNMGPVFLAATDTSSLPPGGPGSPDLVVTAQVAETLRPVAGVTLFHRTMFSNETAIAMTSTSPGVYTASIPTTNLLPGQMLRWRFVASDSIGTTNSLPAFLDPVDNDQYFGIIAADPSITNSRLPVFHWFIISVAAAGTNKLTGPRACVYFKGRFYDNVQVDLHGQTSSTFPKKPYDFDFSSDNRFLWDEDEERVPDIDLLSDYGDKSKVHSAMTYTIAEEVGAAHHFALPIRVQANGAFYGTYTMVEDANEKFLRRIGRDSDGALYKMYDACANANSAEKKTREWEGRTDLAALISSLNWTNPLDDRRRFAYDNLDLPGCINYFVALNLSSSQDHLHKNYYLYRDDPSNTAEWTIFPWDVDLTWGRNWLDSGGYFQDTLFTTNSLHFVTPQQNKGSNRFYQLFFDAPDFRQMYLRRLRTCMNTLLQTNGTPSQFLRMELQFNQWADLLDPPGLGTNSDASLDHAVWGPAWGFSTNRHARTEIQRTIAHYLPGRRTHLFSTNATVRGEAVPDAQPEQVVLSFSDYDVNPASGAQDQEYFSLLNTNTFAVDLSGWTITGAVRHTFRPGTVILPGGGTNQNLGKLFVARSSRGFRARASGPASNQYCFVQEGYEGQLSGRGESLHLLDGTGHEVASLAWTSNPTAAQQYLRVTEIMYHPAPPTQAESNAIPWVLDQDFEYVEIMNIGTAALSLSNAMITSGIFCTFPTNFLLGPTSRAVVVTSTNAFRLRYGTNAVIACVCTGFLNNAGDTIHVVDGVGEPVQTFAYSDVWHPVTDGLGFSLVIRDETADYETWNLKESWRPSGVSGGNPGVADPGDPGLAEIEISEALTHTDLPDVDAIELHNTNAFAVAIGNWYLSDDMATPRKYRIPSNTVLAAGAYLGFDESQFNFPTNAPTAFRISSTGDDIWLFSADAASNLTGFAVVRTFGAAENSVSFGRHVNRAREEYFVPQSTNTPGQSNAYPRVGPAVVSEIMYHPPDVTTILATNDQTQDEFIELANVTSTPLPLYDPAFPTNTWRLRDAVDFDFPPGVILPAHGYAIVVGFDPADPADAAAFRSRYGLPTNAVLHGPWSGKLGNDTDHIVLERPDPPNADEVPYLLVEDITYRDAAPWPVAADGSGQSLARIERTAFGNDPYNWYPAAPTPGEAAALALDSDGDGHVDWSEHYAGTDPANALSHLALSSVSGSATGTVISWTAAAGKTYTVEGATNLLGGPAFSPLQSGLPASLSGTGWVDLSATNGMLRAYRIRVEP